MPANRLSSLKGYGHESTNEMARGLLMVWCACRNRGAQVYLGTSTSMDEVAQWVAEFKGKALAECKRTMPRRMTPQDSANRMKILLKVFSGWVPADLAGAVAACMDCA